MIVFGGQSSSWCEDDPPARPIVRSVVASMLARDWSAAPSEVFTASQDPIVLEAGQANGRGVLTLRPEGQCLLDATCWNLQLAAPIDTGSSLAEFTDLDGLAKDLKLTFEGRWVPGLHPSTLDNFAKSVDNLCNKLGLNESCDEGDAAKALGRSITDRSADTFGAIRRFRKQARRALTVSGSVSHNSYKYFGTSGEKNETDEVGLSLRLAYSAPFGDTNNRWAASVTAQQDYSDSKIKATHCVNIDGSALQQCEVLPLGEPGESQTVVARAQLQWSVGDAAVVSPMVAYDTDRDVFGLELPVYLLRDSDAMFTGGIRLGWRSDDKQVRASVFISKPLTFKLSTE